MILWTTIVGDAFRRTVNVYNTPEIVRATRRMYGFPLLPVRRLSLLRSCSRPHVTFRTIHQQLVRPSRRPAPGDRVAHFRFRPKQVGTRKIADNSDIIAISARIARWLSHQNHYTRRVYRYLGVFAYSRRTLAVVRQVADDFVGDHVHRIVGRSRPNADTGYVCQ